MSSAACWGIDVAFPHTVDGRNPAPVDMVVYPIIYMVLYIPGGAGFLPSTVAILGEFWPL